MRIYRGTPLKSPLIRAGAYVSTMFERAAKYARYPDNGSGNEIGYIFKLEVEGAEVEWEDQRDDCRQGTLKNDVVAIKVAVCDVPLDVANRQSPIRKDGLNSPWVWANGKMIEWVRVDG